MEKPIQMSGIRIDDAPNYTLYQLPEQFIRKHVLPLKLMCSQCRSNLTIDLLRDIHYKHDVFTDEYWRMKEAYKKHLDQWTTLKPENYGLQWPQQEDHRTPQLHIICPVCSKDWDITHHVAAKVPDIRPILEYFHKESTKEARRHYITRPVWFPMYSIIAWCAITIALVVLVVL